MTAEYVIHAKLKNNLLLSRILAEYPTVAAFCAAHCLPQTEVGQYVNLKAKALTDHGEWRATPLRMANALNVLPEELFSEEQREVELKTNEAAVEVTRQQVLAMVDFREALENADLVTHLLGAAQLTAREESVVRGVYFEGAGPSELAKQMRVTQGRVHQIHLRALAKMRMAAEVE